MKLLANLNKVIGIFRGRAKSLNTVDNTEHANLNIWTELVAVREGFEHPLSVEQRIAMLDRVRNRAREARAKSKADSLAARIKGFEQVVVGDCVHCGCSKKVGAYNKGDAAYLSKYVLKNIDGRGEVEA